MENSSRRAPLPPSIGPPASDSKRAPHGKPAARQLKDAALVQPSAEGAHNWNPMSFSPTTGLVYLPVLYDTSLHAIIPNWKMNLHDQTTDLTGLTEAPRVMRISR